MESVESVRQRIAQVREEKARAEGEVQTLETEIQNLTQELREVLGCKPGKEKQSIRELRASVDEQAEHVTELLDEAEAVRDGEEADEDE